MGHTGTLDRFADGLLLVLSGWATRLTDYCHRMDKTYEATMRFGVQTNTLDPEGEIVARGPIPSVTAIADALPRFTGVLQQVPPHYSAIHLGGKRASEIVRGGVTPELSPREVRVERIRFLPDIPAGDESSSQGDASDGSSLDLGIEVSCGSGTYIRALARDIAAYLGTVGMLVSLRRTAIGPFRVSEATDEPDAGQLRDPRELIQVIPGIVSVTLSPDQDAAVRTGTPIPRIPGLSNLLEELGRDEQASEAALRSPDGDIRALVRLGQDSATYHFVVAEATG